MIDTCRYCGIQYHPMPVFKYQDTPHHLDEGVPSHIHVCNIRFFEDEHGETKIFVHSDCTEKAAEEGYIPDPANTLKR